jgi:predicted NAD/FAD-binding protein
MKRIAVVGSGISGLAAAYFLSRRHEVHLFEKDGRLGGHTHTVVADSSAGPVPLDTGFLVHNDRTYPRLVRLFTELGVETVSSDMCFAVACAGTGLEYSSRGPRGFFAQLRNVLSPSHLGLLTEILRFNREAPKLLASPDAERMTLGEFLEVKRFSEVFVHRYLLPMASAIWSASLASISSFPALTMIRFLDWTAHVEGRARRQLHLHSEAHGTAWRPHICWCVDSGNSARRGGGDDSVL